MNQDFFLTTLWGNTMAQYLQTLVIYAGGMGIAWALEKIVLARFRAMAAATETTLDDFLADLLHQRGMPLVYLLVFYGSLHSPTLTGWVQKGFRGVVSIWAAVVLVQAALEAIRYLLLEVWAAKQPEPAGMKSRIGGLMPVLRTLVWGLGLVILLDNLGFKINTLVAGLGIGGIAVALAAQTVLGDLFSYFAIVMDRPFVIGDFIVVGDLMGAVERIGIKSTKIRSLSGELLVLSNKDLTDSRIRNFKHMTERRVVFKIGAVYQTATAALREIPGILKAIIQKTPDTRFDRAHFMEFADSSLNVEIVYYVLSPDYNRYMDVHQAILLAIKEEFERRKIEFAYPSQTVFLAKS